MESLKKRWKSIPSGIRRPMVLIVGSLVVIAAPFTGVLPGPGGIPVFLVGIAILASEFEWARRIRDPIIDQVNKGGKLWRQHKILGTIAIIVAAAIFGTASYFLYKQFKA